MDSGRAVLLLLVLFFVFLSPDGTDQTPSQQNELHDQFQQVRYNLDVLRNSTSPVLEPEGLNLTGFKITDGFAWDILPLAKERAWEQLKSVLGDVGVSNAEGTAEHPRKQERLHENTPWDALRADDKTRSVDEIPIYRNVSGLVVGEWVRSRHSQGIKLPHVNLTTVVGPNMYATERYDRNITGKEGKMQVSFSENENGATTGDSAIRNIKASVVIRDDTSTGDGWDAQLHGVHYLDFGAIILATTSDK
jgi:transmembrane E3 ubiquitin-protein ligase